eukprot:6882224-Prymnesium_polylepis.1
MAAAHAWMAAPRATTSSGLTPLKGSLPKKPWTTLCTFGMRVMPPTRITSATSLVETPVYVGVYIDVAEQSKSSNSSGALLLVLRRPRVQGSCMQ